MKRLFLTLFSTLMVTLAFAQAPSTDILLVPLPDAGAASVMIAADDIVRLTDNDLYDNQPSFTPDGAAVLYVSMDEAGQTDIYRYDLASGEAVQVTDTPESEFSPQVTPDGEHIAAVRIEADGVTQRLWQFDLDGQNAEAVPENVERVGYYAFANPETLAFIIVAETESGEPLSLQTAAVATGETEMRTEPVGVGVQKVPGQDAVSFVQRLEDGTSMIRVLDLTTGEIRDLTTTLLEVDAHAWLSDGMLLAAQDSIVYSWQEGQEDWQPYLDFSGASVGNIGRLAVSPDASQLAFVITK